MVTWLIQPVKVEAEKINTLMNMLTQAGIPFEIIYPYEGQILTTEKISFEFNPNIQYFVCGSYSLTRLVHQATTNAVFSLENFSFDKIWDVFGKENFINHDAEICNTKNIDWNKQEEYFVRPLEDTKSFNGGIYNKNTLKFSGDVVISSLKHISKEHRFFVIDNKIVTGSLYKINGELSESSILDQGAVNFAEEMIKKFQYDGYVIDIGTIDNEYKIMELNCLNASGFYSINLYKLIMAVEDHYDEFINKKIKKVTI